MSKKETLKKMKKYRFIYIVLIPILLYFVIFAYGPLAMGIIQSFHKIKLSGKTEFVAWDNYLKVINDPVFIQSIQNALFIGIIKWLLLFVCSLLLALGLNEVYRKSYKTLVQTTSYLPYLLSWTIVGGIWIFLLSPNGLVNGVLKALTGQEPILFMTRKDLAPWIIILTGVWKDMGYYAVLFLASIVAINPNIFEAAQIDGANRLKQIRRLILPEIRPTMRTLLILSIMGLFGNFDQVFVMGNPAINQVIRTPILYIYEKGIQRFDIGVATAASAIVLILTFTVTMLVRYVLYRKES